MRLRCATGEEYRLRPEAESHVIWELTGRCNQSCKYCYPSRLRGAEAPRSRVEELLAWLAEAPFENIHLTGGEPQLSPYLVPVVRALRGRRLYLTTNLTVLTPDLARLLEEGALHSVAVSLDAVDAAENDFLRGGTAQVLGNLNRLLEARAQGRMRCLVRIHCVVTRRNLTAAEDLLRWAARVGVDGVSCQPVALPSAHPWARALCLRREDLPQFAELLALEETLFGGSYARTHRFFTELFLRAGPLTLESAGEPCGPFIDAAGEVWTCPLRRQRLARAGEGAACTLEMQCMTCLKHFTPEEA